ncbi:MAG: protein kinase [Labilithrix sp.]|nr:protein kinase [Labilithrix sp.]
MADVFLSVARGQMGFNKLAVIKRLRQALAEEAAFRNMFLDEARLAARLSHPNIVHTYEVGEQNGVYFIAMEYLEGQSLNKVLKEALRRKEGVEAEVGARIVADALSGLHYAHDLRDYDGRPLNVIHRDVSPHNIFVTYDGHTKLVDFGIAKAALSSTETEVGVLKGKVAYMSPEQAMGGRIDCRSDLFAMGIVLWELLARQRLMTGESAANTLHKLMNEPIPRVSQVIGNIDPALDAIVAKALEKDPQYRWQSAIEMRDALEGWLRAQPHPARQEEVGRKMLYLFHSVREEVQRQIQRHMAALTAATNTQELQALTAESLHRMEQSGANVSGQLLRLGGSGSGSGVVANYGLGTHASQFARGNAHSHSHSLATEHPPQKSNTLLIVLAVGFFLLAGLLIVVVGLRNERQKGDAPLAADSSGQGDTQAQTTTSPSGGPAVASTETTPPASGDLPAGVVPPTTGTAATNPVVATKPPISTPTNRPVNTPVKPPVTPPVKSAATTTAPPSNDQEPGFLTVSSYPWSKVTAGGRVICPATPCNKVQMAPGTYTLVFENSEQGLKGTSSVTIKSGETASRNLGLK